ncbi:unnamed protein product [Bursaphelenchus okinawaensis]|uniref:glutathione transferase n=1 Tax=Bursaphelenchus okinawaensis TaxID=465554 RepID=A0A811KFX5_9BILA|nr:unnamed protein product [Bursaphelenchus okinawaensis]CAG9101474.1 unnamed protein product [Bursaphelenchus okinawaensis]
MSNFELIYFNARGRAEVSRLCFHHAGITFTDTRMTKEEWAEKKSDTSRFPYNQVPVLFIDGKPLTESHSINRYVANLTKLAGKDELEAAFVDQAYEKVRNMIETIEPFYLVPLGFATGDYDQLYKDVFVPGVQKHFPQIIGLLKPSGFFGENGPTYADFYLAGYIESFLKHGFPEVNKFPPIIKHLTDVKNVPQLQKYLSTRPDTKG